MLERKLNIHYIWQSSKFHFGREKQTHLVWTWTLKSILSLSCKLVFFLRNLVFNLLHHIIKTTLAWASTCKPNLIIKLVMRVHPQVTPAEQHFTSGICHCCGPRGTSPPISRRWCRSIHKNELGSAEDIKRWVNHRQMMSYLANS